jgi:uncharacterized damage-inducible protein DinB
VDQLMAIRNRHTRLIDYSCQILGNIMQGLSQELATTARDGDDGWTVLEVLGHLRDFDTIFRNRAIMMINEEYPHLPAYDHEAMAIDGNYNGQHLVEVYAELQQSRRQTISFFQELSETDWERSGIHPERGHFTMTDAVMQVGFHEVNHIEQITRIIAVAKKKA